jgi:ABC-2 type transport system permease protein
VTTLEQLPEAREIHGPSAYGGGFGRFVSLTWLIAFNEFRLSYFGSVLGYLWSLMRPLMQFGVLYVIFSQVLNFGKGIPHYGVLLLFNIVLFLFFQDTTTQAVRSVVNRELLVRKMQFPRLVIPLSVVVTQLLNLATNLVAVVIFMTASGVEPGWKWLLFPLLLIPLTIFTSAVAMILSSLYVPFRDVLPIWGVLATVLFYGTPVLYPIDKVPAGWDKVVLANPIADILVQGRRWLFEPSAPGAWHAIGGLPWALIPIAVFVGVTALGIWLFNYLAPRVAERL